MKILVVGGTGMIGTHVSRHLKSHGNEVSIAARTAPAQGSMAAEFPCLVRDYTRDEFTSEDLSAFEAVVFAAGNDIRHIPDGIDVDEFWNRTQSEGVPNFVSRAKAAGVRRVVQIGSYYHQVLPDLVESNVYVQARALADSRSREYADEDFNVVTLNPPSIIGVVPGGPIARIARILQWADGELPEVPNFAPSGGTNYMSVRSLAEATWGALQNSQAGKAYLIGDANLSFREYFQMIFDAAGSKIQLVERDEEHPFLPDRFIVQGRGNAIRYETDPADDEVLAYTQGDVPRAVSEVVAQTRASAT